MDLDPGSFDPFARSCNTLVTSGEIVIDVIHRQGTEKAWITLLHGRGRKIINDSFELRTTQRKVCVVDAGSRCSHQLTWNDRRHRVNDMILSDTSDRQEESNFNHQFPMVLNKSVSRDLEKKERIERRTRVTIWRALTPYNVMSLLKGALRYNVYLAWDGNQSFGRGNKLQQKGPTPR